MHEEVRRWVAEHMPSDARTVLEFGGANINGTLCDLVPGSLFVVDLFDRPNVNAVADARDWTHPEPVDVVLCCEVAEHCQGWERLVTNAHANLKPGGLFIFTAAGPGRSPHGAWGDPGPGPDEFYENIEPEALAEAASCFGHYHIDVFGLDIRMWATRSVTEP